MDIKNNTLKSKPMKIIIKDPKRCRIIPAYKLSDSDSKILKKEIDYWIDRGIARYMNIDDILVHSSPAFVVHRLLGHKDGKPIYQSRVVINFQELNDNTHLYYHKNITIEEIYMNIGSYYRYNKSDVHKYFYQLMIAPESQRYCGISTKYGHLIVSRVYQGLSNAPIYGHQKISELYHGTDVLALQDDVIGGTPLIVKSSNNNTNIKYQNNDSNKNQYFEKIENNQ